MSHKRPRGVRIDPGLDASLVAFAESQERTVSWVIERAVRYYLTTHATGDEAVERAPAGPVSAGVQQFLRAKRESRAS